MENNGQRGKKNKNIQLKRIKNIVISNIFKGFKSLPLNIFNTE